MDLPYLYQAIDTAFNAHSYCLIMIGSICSAIYKRDGQYFYFDSHSHGQNGLSLENGTSILVSFHSLQDLVTFMYAVFESMMIDISQQFDLLPVSFTIGPCMRNEDKEYKRDKRATMALNRSPA